MAAQTFEEFGCDVESDNPDTPDMITYDRLFAIRGIDEIRKDMPDGEELRFWSFRFQDDSDGTVPGPLMRVVQNDVVHTHLEASKGVHTVHHHGIEPTPMNDGVGHTSFETPGGYTYQWQPRYAGTYFYHCHVNTALHFQMGMWAPLIVDPQSGQQRLYDPLPGDVAPVDTSYDVEAFMAMSDVDPVWREQQFDDGLCGEDAGQNDFRPEYFEINGVAHPDTLTDPAVVINVQVGQRLLLRLVNASYSVIKTTLGGLPATIVGVDGRPLRTNVAEGDFSSPISVAANEPIETTSAVRYDLIIEPTQAGTYTVEHEFLQWITGERDTRAGGSGIAQTRIHVSS